jgi:RNA polymerase sigma-70 factor (ECF subfamily)
VPLDAEAFAAFVAERAAGGLPSPAYAADLYLACACASGAPGAADAFCQAFAGEIERAVRKVAPSHLAVDEITQALHERLLVGPAGAPGKIAGYGGRSALATWVHVSAARLAINLGIKERDRSGEVARETPAEPPSPEIEYLKRRYKSDFEDALRAGVKRLSNEQRELLRSHFVEGMTVDLLAERLAVGRSTAARRLAAARSDLQEQTLQVLRDRLRLSASQLESLGGLVRSRIEVSVAGLLRDP